MSILGDIVCKAWQSNPYYWQAVVAIQASRAQGLLTNKDICVQVVASGGLILTGGGPLGSLLGDTFANCTCSHVFDDPDMSGPVIAFADINWEGDHQSFDVGIYHAGAGQMAKVGDKALSSIFVPTGYRVNLCERSDGEAQRYILEPGLYANLDFYAFNDRCSFIQVERFDAHHFELGWMPPPVAYAINAHGVVVGCGREGGASVYRIGKDKRTPVAAPPSTLFDVNDLGFSVGRDSAGRPMICDPTDHASHVHESVGSTLYGINNANEAVGQDYQRMALFYDRKSGTFEPVAAPPSVLFDINDSGVAVGQNSSFQAMVYDRTTRTTHEFGGRGGVLFGINKAGVAVGRDDAGRPIAYDTKSHNLQVIDGGVGTLYRINAHGVAAGVLNDEPMLWTLESGKTQVSIAAKPARLYGINDAGLAVGRDKDGDAFVYDSKKHSTTKVPEA